jgi:hypothetical protein
MCLPFTVEAATLNINTEAITKYFTVKIFHYIENLEKIEKI